MRLIDADNYIGKVIASHCYSGVNKVIRIDDVPTVDVNNLIIAEIEKIKAEIEEYMIISFCEDDDFKNIRKIIEEHISELKGEQEWKSS